jgi:MFS family permease
MANDVEKYEIYTEKIFQEIGAFGKFQKLNMLLMLFLATLPAITIYVTIFNLAEPKLTCHDKRQNITIESDKLCQVWINITVSKDNKEDTYYTCEFDKTYYSKTIVTDWDLICNRKYLASFTQTFYLIGTVLALFTGYFGDRFGRKRSISAFFGILSVVLLLSQILQSSFLNISITTKYVVYCVTQIIVGTFSYCLYVSSYVIVIESTTSSYHTLFSNVHLMIYVLGEILVLIPSYFIRNWEINNWIIIGFSFIGFFFTIFFLNESPRWLISQKRFKEAAKILNKIAMINGKKLDKKIQLKVFESDSLNGESKVMENEVNSTKYQNSSVRTMLQLICSPAANLKKTALLTVVWFSLNLLYYGVSLGVTSIDSIDPYLMYLFSSIAEFCGYMLCFINNKISRRKSIVIFFTLSGIICLVISFIPRNADPTNKKKVIIDAAVVMILASIGKCVSSAAFNTCYLFTAEYYPTKVRSFAFMFISCIGNIGGFVSPQVNLSKDLWKPLPFIIFSLFSLIGSTSVLLLPKIKKTNTIHVTNNESVQ